MKKHLSILGILVAVTGLVIGISQVSATVPGVNQLASQDSSGNYANGPSDSSGIYEIGKSNRISKDGRYVIFASTATNLVPNDTNNRQDVFVRDTVANTTVRASVWAAGTQLNTNNYEGAISSDGRYVLFSDSFNLYQRDLINQTTTTASDPNCQGTRGGSMSGDGRFVTFTCGHTVAGNPSNGKPQVYIRDMHTGSFKQISVDASGNLANSNDTYSGGLSCDGSVASFISKATNLPGNSAGVQSLFVAHLGWDGTIELKRAASSSSGTLSHVSCDGSTVLYEIAKKYDRLTGQITTASLNSVGNTVSAWGGSVSDDGRFVAFTSSVNGVDPLYPTTGGGSGNDIYIRDTKKNTTQIVSFTPAGNRSGRVNSVSISPDGSKVAYLYNTPSNTNPIHELISGVNTGTSGTQWDIYVSETGF